jgi:hypothetical protein
MKHYLQPFSVPFQVVILCLHGEDGIGGRSKTLRAWDTFCHHLPSNYGFAHYVDPRGFYVFCVTLLTTHEYRAFYYLELWEAFCKEFEVIAGTSYERSFPFHDVILEGRILEIFKL